MVDMEVGNAAEVEVAAEGRERFREDGEGGVADGSADKKLRLDSAIDGVEVKKEEKKLIQQPAEAMEDTEIGTEEEATTGKLVTDEADQAVLEEVNTHVQGGPVARITGAEASPRQIADSDDDAKGDNRPFVAKIGPMAFSSSMDAVDYFYNLLRQWPLNFHLNKYEHMMLEDLLNRGHSDPESKRGAGIKAFQVRVNPDFDSRCYHIIRCDGSVTDFSYRKCLDNIVSLPDRFKTPNGKRFGVKKKRKRRGGCWGCQDNPGKDGQSSGGNAGDNSVAYFSHMKFLHKSKTYRAEKRKKYRGSYGGSQDNRGKNGQGTNVHRVAGHSKKRQLPGKRF